jgi:hypothetical protein
MRRSSARDGRTKAPPLPPVPDFREKAEALNPDLPGLATKDFPESSR